jgi:polyribonucleotide nucleotidyltransferase
MQVEITDIDARGKISLVPVAAGDDAPAEAPAEAEAAAAPAGE